MFGDYLAVVGVDLLVVKVFVRWGGRVVAVGGGEEGGALSIVGGGVIGEADGFLGEG